jgi:hypothetical protein
MFSARLINHNDTRMLNICDADLLGKTLNNGDFTLKISEGYYAQKIVEEEEAKELLKGSNSINMVGKEIIALSVNIGIGSQDGVKEIDGIPFLIVFKM